MILAAETLPWGATVGIITAAFGIILVLIKLMFNHLSKSNLFYQKRIDALRDAYWKQSEDDRLNYEKRMDAKNEQVNGIVEKFNDTVNTTLNRVCTERDKEDEMMKSFMNHVKDEHSSMIREHERQEQNQNRMAENQTKVAEVLTKIAEKLDVSMNGKVQK